MWMSKDRGRSDARRGLVSVCTTIIDGRMHFSGLPVPPALYVYHNVICTRANGGDLRLTMYPDCYVQLTVAACTGADRWGA